MGGTSEISSQLLPYWDGNSDVSFTSTLVGAVAGSNSNGNNGGSAGVVAIASVGTIVVALKSAIALTALVMNFLRRLGSR